MLYFIVLEHADYKTPAYVIYQRYELNELLFPTLLYPWTMLFVNPPADRYIGADAEFENVICAF